MFNEAVQVEQQLLIFQVSLSLDFNAALIFSC